MKSIKIQLAVVAAMILGCCGNIFALDPLATGNPICKNAAGQTGDCCAWDGSRFADCCPNPTKDKPCSGNQSLIFTGYYKYDVPYDPNLRQTNTLGTDFCDKVCKVGSYIDGKKHDGSTLVPGTNVLDLAVADGNHSYSSPRPEAKGQSACGCKVPYKLATQVTIPANGLTPVTSLTTAATTTTPSATCTIPLGGWVPLNVMNEADRLCQLKGIENKANKWCLDQAEGSCYDCSMGAQKNPNAYSTGSKESPVVLDLTTKMPVCNCLPKLPPCTPRGNYNSLPTKAGVEWRAKLPANVKTGAWAGTSKAFKSNQGLFIASGYGQTQNYYANNICPNLCWQNGRVWADANAEGKNGVWTDSSNGNECYCDKIRFLEQQIVATELAKYFCTNPGYNNYCKSQNNWRGGDNPKYGESLSFWPEYIKAKRNPGVSEDQMYCGCNDQTAEGTYTAGGQYTLALPK